MLKLCQIVTGAAIAVFLLALSSLACDIRVRDSAFRMIRDVHRLVVIAESSDKDADAIQSRLEEWLDATNGDFNLEVVRIDADDPETNWQSVGIPSAPPALPVTVLVGQNNGVGESFLIDYWESEPDDAALAAIAASPVRTQLARQLATNVAVLVYAPINPTSLASVPDHIQSIVAEGVSEERIGLSLLTVDRSDPAERLLCRFMGLRPDSPDTLCIAFGRGKLMGPPLVGDEIRSDNIDRMLAEILLACSCSKPLPTMGVDLPLIWTDEVDSTVMLMDEEIDLSNLEAEVQSMLADKSVGRSVGAPKIIPIPPGRKSKSLSQDSPASLIQRNNTPIGLMVAAGVALLFLVTYVAKRTQRSDSR